MKPKSLMLLIILPLVLVCPAGFAQENGNGRHSRLHAVPVPGAVTVDGDLKDWDRSGELETYVMSATRAMQFGKLAVMYDKEALYIGGVFKKPYLIINRHSPEANGDRAWDADALQFRLTLDPALGYPVRQTTSDANTSDQILHLLLWHYTDRNEACLQAQRSMQYHDLPGSGKFGVLPHDRYQAAWKFNADKNEATFEYRIPWATLGAKRPLQGDDVVAASYQFNFGRRDGLKTAGYSGWAYDLKVTPGFSYQNAGCWGKMIFSKSGKLPRELVVEGEVPAPALPCTFTAKLPADGEVSVVLFNEKNEGVRVLMASAPRHAGQLVEKWDGLDELGKPLPAGTYTWKGLYHQPITTKYLLSVHNSGQPPFKTDDNTGGWGGDHGNPVSVCAAGDDMILAWDGNEAGYGLIRTDIEGKKRWGIINSQGCLASDGQRIFADTHEFGTGLRCFDVKDGRPLPWANGASELAKPTGVPQATRVAGMAFAQGKLYVSFTNENLVAAYDTDKGTLLTTWPVPKPGSLAARPDGSVAGIIDGQLVELRDGKITRLADHHLDQPAGIAVATDGTIYVANQGKLQNISVFSPTGEYRTSIGKAGGRPSVGKFDPTGMLKPVGLAIDAKGRLWVMEHIDSPKRVSVWDVNTGKLAKEFFGSAHYSSFIWMDPARPNEVYCDGAIWKIDWKKKTSEPLITISRPEVSDLPGVGLWSTHTGGCRIFTSKNGHQYVWDFMHGIVYVRESDSFKLIIALGRGWIDANNDQHLQPSETNSVVTECSYWVGHDLSLWGTKGILRPVKFERDGRPIYDYAKVDPRPAAFRPAGIDPDGSVYAYDNGYDWGGLAIPKGLEYGRFGVDGMVYWGYRGRVSWPNAINHPPQRLAKIWGITELLGTADDFTGFGTYYGCHHIYTRKDGIPVALLFRDPRIALGELAGDVIACENYNGQLVKPKGMNRYFALGGDVDGRINEVFGLDTVKLLPGGTYVHSEADVKQAIDALTQYQAALARAVRLVIVRGTSALSTAPTVERLLTENQSFKARLAYDENNLYAQYEVVGPTELTSAMTDPKTIFKGGNLLDIQFATDPSADPSRKTPAPGDVRLLVTRRDGKPYAVVFRPKVKGFSGTPTVLTSPTGKESFDAIEVSDAVQLDYRKSAVGFAATVTVPFAVLGWTPLPGSQVRLDLGYIFGNTTGTKATGRLYWTNNGFAAGVLNDIPTESRLEPKEWGTATVE